MVIEPSPLDTSKWPRPEPKRTTLRRSSLSMVERPATWTFPSPGMNVHRRIGGAGERHADAPVVGDQRAVEGPQIDRGNAAAGGRRVDAIGADAGEQQAPIARVRGDIGALHVGEHDAAVGDAEVDVTTMIFQVERAVDDVGDEFCAQPARVDPVGAGDLDERRRRHGDLDFARERAEHQVVVAVVGTRADAHAVGSLDRADRREGTRHPPAPVGPSGHVDAAGRGRLHDDMHARWCR